MSTTTNQWMPREKALAQGLDRLGDSDLLALLLGTGTAGASVFEVASGLLAVHGGLEGLSRLHPPTLAESKGLGPARALRLAAAFELGRRAQLSESRPRKRVTRAEDVSAYVTAQLGRLDHEEMWLLCLDGQNGVRTFRKVAQGGLHGCSVSARDILRSALLDAASAIVVCHNHPSGDPTPSPADVLMTRQLSEAAEQVGIALVDHVIVARGLFSSMLELGILQCV